MEWFKPLPRGLNSNKNARKIGIKRYKQECALFIIASVMKEVGWVAGDKVTIGVEGDNVFIKRDNDGYTLGPTEGASKDLKGKAVSVKANLPKSFPVAGSSQHFAFGAGTIAFKAE